MTQVMFLVILGYKLPGLSRRPRLQNELLDVRWIQSQIQTSLVAPVGMNQKLERRIQARILIHSCHVDHEAKDAS